MKQIRILLLTSLIVLGVAGCGSSPPVRFYALEPVQPGVVAPVAEKVIGLGPIRFPDYLKRPQIVTQQAGGIKLAEFDRWVEPVDSAFARTLAANLDILLESATVIVFPFGGGLVEVDYRLLASVTRFDVGVDGTAVLDIQWGVEDGRGTGLLRTRRASFSARVSDMGSYSSIVDALNETLDALSRELAASFRSLDTAPVSATDSAAAPASG